MKIEHNIYEPFKHQTGEVLIAQPFPRWSRLSGRKCRFCFFNCREKECEALICSPLDRRDNFSIIYVRLASKHNVNGRELRLF